MLRLPPKRRLLTRNLLTENLRAIWGEQVNVTNLAFKMMMFASNMMSFAFKSDFGATSLAGLRLSRPGCRGQFSMETNHDFILKNVDFLMRNPDFLLKNVDDFIIKKNSLGTGNIC